ncbi:MAG: PucR family transcriptional regulator ligand-binding domain-containing protein [Lachnospiraceae bacterium]|nr:PucR family transcriptional regulator ligand-binding domain-containing protein [Lachnospiraceae bacterium]
MGFTVEDMLIIGAERYEMKLIAGNNGWANSISWLMMVEDLTIISNFSGKELAVTTGLGFTSEKKLEKLVIELDQHHAAGLILNTGYYMTEVPKKIIDLCNTMDLPLLTVPWNVVITDMIKDFSVRIFLQGTTDEKISAALIDAIENYEDREHYANELLQTFDVDGDFQAVLMTTGNLDAMDTVERKRIGYRLQIYMENISHNAHFFYYDGYFVLIANAVNEKTLDNIVDGFEKRLIRRMPDTPVAIGIGSCVKDISNLHLSYRRAEAAVKRALRKKTGRLKFDELGVDRLFLAVTDKTLLYEMGEKMLKPILDYDKEHDSNYEETLYNYLRFDGSVLAVGKEMYIHRNTITYRMNKIKELLGCNLENAEERLPYEIACRILRM